MTIDLIQDDDSHIPALFPISSINFGLQEEFCWKVKKARKRFNSPSNLSSHAGVSCHVSRALSSLKAKAVQTWFLSAQE